MSLAEEMKSAGIKVPNRKRSSPLWEGPCGEGPQGGVTFSLLSKWLVCRERARLTLVEGYKPVRVFNHKTSYGDMWHTCEEAHAAGADFHTYLTPFCRDLCKQYQQSQQQIDHWYRVCCKQFPVYVAYWKQHRDVVARQPLLEEQVFDVPYKLPSGRVVRLRGKWDSVDLITKGPNKGVWAQENKTKGQVNPEVVRRQLKMDLQTMLYLVALYTGDAGLPREVWKYPIRGVRYNVIRRPLSGGKGTIVRKKPSKANPRGESKDDYYKRVAKYIEDNPQDYFMRWDVPVSAVEVSAFKTKVLNPTLEQLCCWWEWVSVGDPWREGNLLHTLHPMGVFNSLNEGGSTDFDEAVFNGSRVGLARVENLFPELEV